MQIIISLAVSQFKVRILGTENHIYPDITLFLNGSPIAVIEAKSPKVNDPMSEAIEQLLRYSEQRSDTFREGNKEFFFFNQIVVATCRDTAKFGTITTHIEKAFLSLDRSISTHCKMTLRGII